MTGRPPGTIRIVAGARRGHRIKVARAATTRPTSERVREAIFDALGPVDGLSAVDLFAGTGALGLEALSRGAAQCIFVESDPAVAAVLHENIAALAYDTQARVITADYLQTAGSLAGKGLRADLLFIDPPYRILAEVEERLAPLLPSLLSVDGVAVIEGGRSSHVNFGQSCVFDRVYGGTRITMITMNRSTA